MRYVKICPRCGTQNDELSDSCAADGEFLGMVPATPAPKCAGEPPLPQPGAVPVVHEGDSRFAPGGPSAAVNTRADQQQRAEKTSDAPEPCPREPDREAEAESEPELEARPALFLESGGGGQVFEVHEGDVIGQAHPSSNAQIQLADLTGIGYVHRNHCSFAFRDKTWQVTAIAQQTYTNPTLVNQQRLSPGESRPLRNGDRLTLSGLTLAVRIIEF